MRLVSAPHQAIGNIHAFQRELASAGTTGALFENLSHFRAWYATKDEQGNWVFGPSKFIGYQGMTASEYQRSNRDGLDGRMTEKALGAWFREVCGTDIYDELREALFDFLSRYGKKPSALFRVSVPIEQTQAPTQHSEAAEALLTVYRSLPNEVRSEFRRLLLSEAG